MVAGGLRHVPKLVWVTLEGQVAGGALHVCGKVAPSAARCFEGSEGLAEPMGTAGRVGLACRRTPKALMLL